MYNYLKTAPVYGTASSHIEISGANFTSGNTASVKFTHVTGGDLMTIMTGGNVGIGVTGPVTKLDIAVAPSAPWMKLINEDEPAFNLTTYNNGTNNGSTVYAFKHGLYYGGTENAAIAFYRGPSSVGGFLAFTTDNGTERMRITSGGAVYMGRTGPDISTETGFRFDANGEAYASLDTSGTNAWHVYDMVNNAYRFYVSSAGQIYATATSISAISDVTLKENIKPLETGLNEVMKLQPRRFDWKNGDGKNIAGFVAQEVEQVLPDLVSDYKYNDEETKKSLKMGDMIPTLVKAIQELKAEIEILKNK